MFTGSKASEVKEPEILHGIYGANHLRNLMNEFEPHNQHLPFEQRLCRIELEQYARICESHTFGSGMLYETIKDIADLEKIEYPPHASPGRERGWLADNFYEKVIGYADWRIHAEKIEGTYFPKIVSEEEAMEKTRSFGLPEEQIGLIKDLCDYINKLTGDRLK
jgi:hypothetical protein